MYFCFFLYVYTGLYVIFSTISFYLIENPFSKKPVNLFPNEHPNNWLII